MISYTEKGPGLHAAIAAAGHVLKEENGAWRADDAAAVQAIIDGYTSAHAAAAVCLDIDAHAKALRDRAVRNISPGEMASWTIKRTEAAAYQASGLETDAPMLAAEAAARGAPISALVTRVLGNSAALSVLEATISGVCGKHKDTVKSLAAGVDFAAIAAYDWTTGWPAP